MTTPAPLPLTPRYDLDLNLLPAAPAGPTSWEGFESLYLQWRLEKPTVLRCHPSVYYTLMSCPPPERVRYQIFTGGDPTQVYGIQIVVDAENLAHGAWRLMRGLEEIDSGTI